jgi:hypothetical protein
VHPRTRAAHAARRDGGRRRGRARSRCSTRAAPATTPSSDNGRCSSREPFEADAGGELRRGVEAAARAGARRRIGGASYWATPRSSPPPHPDRMFGPAARARTPRGVGDSPSRSGRRDALARRAGLRVRCARQRGATRRGPAPVDDAAAFHARCRLRPDAVHACPLAPTGSARSPSRTSPDRLGLPAIKVLGASWAVARALRERPGRAHARRRQRRATTAAPSRTSRAARPARAHLPAARRFRAPRRDQERGRRGPRRRR